MRTRIARILDSAAFTAAVSIQQRLPTGLAVRVREATRLTGALDYRAQPLRMVLETTAAKGRLHSCRKEPETVRWLERSLRAGDVFYDVGANVGAYTLIAAALLRGQGHVCAFEPGASNFSTLCENVWLNGLSDLVIPLPVALSDVTQLLTLCYRTPEAGTAGHQVTRPDGPSALAVTERHKSHSIMAYRLDDLTRHFDVPPPTVIKIDVDGTEVDVLAGASVTLSSPALRGVLIEAGSETGPSVVATMEHFGWRVAERHTRVHELSIFNYVFERNPPAR